MENTAAPASSTHNVEPTTHCTSRTTPPSTSSFKESRMIMRSRREMVRPMTRKIIVAKVMKPRPPVWISTSSTTWPKVEYTVPVSRTTSPVTHTAEVEVNSASNQPTRPGSAHAAGSDKSALPMRISAAKPAAITGSGLKPLRR